MPKNKLCLLGDSECYKKETGRESWLIEERVVRIGDEKDMFWQEFVFEDWEQEVRAFEV